MREPLTVSFQYAPVSMGKALEMSASLRNPHAFQQASMAAAAAGYDARAITCVSAKQELIGVWPMAAPKPLSWLRPLKSPVVPLYDVIGSPMISAGFELPALQAIFDQLRELPSSPKVLLIKSLPAEGLVWEALNKLAEDGNISLNILETWERAIFERKAAQDAETYLSEALSGSTRKRLRNKRRALEEVGGLSLVVHREKADVEAGFHRFLLLEAAGWKGANKTALKQHPKDAQYILAMLENMAAVERAFVAELCQGSTTIASGLFLRCAGDVFFLKTTYDETQSKESPGVIFDLMITDYLYQQPWFERLDTSTDSSVDPARLIWKQRQKMANVVIDCKPSSLHGHSVVAVQRLRLWLKKRLKRTEISLSQTAK